MMDVTQLSMLGLETQSYDKPIIFTALQQINKTYTIAAHNINNTNHDYLLLTSVVFLRFIINYLKQYKNSYYF